MTDTERDALIEKAARAIWNSATGAEVWEALDEDDWSRDLCFREAEAALEAVGFFSPVQDAPSLHLAATVRNTTHLREAILSAAADAYDDVAERAEAPLCSRFALECALERIGHFEVRDAAAHLAATVREMLSPVSTLPSPQRLDLEAALEAVERLARD